MNVDILFQLGKKPKYFESNNLYVDLFRFMLKGKY